LKALFTLVLALVLTSPLSAKPIAIDKEKIEQCRTQSDEAECIFGVYADYISSPEYAAVCATDDPTNREACLIYSVQFLCLGFDLAAALSPAAMRELAVRGRGASSAMLFQGPLEPTHDMLALVSAPWDFLQGEACNALDDAACLKRMQDKVRVANGLGAYQKYGFKQCFRETTGLSPTRVDALLAAKKDDL